MLYLAMEDFRVDVIVGKGPGATAIPLELPPFTVVGATTRAGLLPAPLRDRFGFTGAPRLLRHRRPGHASCTARPRLLGVEADEAGIAEIARRSRGTPRIANRLLRRVRDWAQVHGQGHVDHEAAHAALALFDVDDRGLDRLDRAVLEALCRRFGGGTGGAVARSPSPWARSPTPSRPWPSRSSCARATSCARPRGRAAAPLAWEHLGLEPPAGLPPAGGAAAARVARETGAGPGRFSGCEAGTMPGRARWSA